MRSRTVLFVVLAVVLALGGVYLGWSTNSPKAAADAPATPPSSVGPAQEASSTRSRSPGTAAPKGSTDKGVKDTGAKDKGATESGDKPAPPPSSKPQRATGPVRFGQVTTADRPNETGISDDRRALTTTFSDFEVIANLASAEPSVTKSFSMTMPLTDGANGDVLGFHVSGWSATTDGATARMTLRGGGKVKVKDFPTGWDSPYVESLWLPATPGTTYRLSVVLEVHKDAAGGGTPSSTPPTSRAGSADPGRRTGTKAGCPPPGPYALQACGPPARRAGATVVDRVACQHRALANTALVASRP